MFIPSHGSPARAHTLARLAPCIALAFLLSNCFSLYAQQTGAAPKLPDAPGAAGSRANAANQTPGPADPAMIAGTVLDTNGDVVEGARVVLSGMGGEPDRTLTSGADGEFTFTGLPPDSYRLTVSRAGMGTWVSPEMNLHAGDMRFVKKVVLAFNGGVQEVRVYASQEQLATEQVHAEESQRVLGVFPNFYSSFDPHAVPMNARQKFQLAFRSEIDPMTFLGAAAIAGGEEGKKIDQGYGQEAGGFGKRFAAQYTNDFNSRMIGSALLPSLFHQDPRYFYKGTGTIRSRILYAMKSAFICRGDNGKSEFDFSHIGGDFAAGGLSNLYYPESNEGVSLVFTNGLIEIGGMAGTNLIREFVLRGITSHVPGHSSDQQ
ncbi:MAG: carboxypeptidase-like regulatory domain-containing protein [Acidobacteriaceae bacterium]